MNPRVEISGSASGSAPSFDLIFYNESGGTFQRLEDLEVIPVIRSVESEENIWIRDEELVGRWVLENVGIQTERSLGYNRFREPVWGSPDGFVHASTAYMKYFLGGPLDSQKILTVSGRANEERQLCTLEITPSEDSIDETSLVLSSKGNSNWNRTFSSRYTTIGNCADFGKPESNWGFGNVRINGANSGIDALTSVYWETSLSSRRYDSNQPGVPMLVMDVTTQGERGTGYAEFNGPARVRFVKACNADQTPTPFYQIHYLDMGYTGYPFPQDMCGQ